MYLKKLNISGFKSFADPVCLEFSKGISAIVGPNGSGKSNITDAIKWVLGEQSIKSLRGKKMEDVIFSGTEKKASSGYAEVILTLDNSDEDLQGFPEEVVISRKLFRSGESDYSINKRRCKLKDVHTLFMDTGLGKNGYSLISQGGIENIISSSPTELRGIFEEAVGIVSYKTKKNEAERKLEHTQGNLDRLRDIMQEIEKQLGPLKNQSRKAKAFLELREELKTVDLVIFYDKMTVAVKEMKDLKSSLADQKKACDADEKSIEEKDALYQKLTNQNREIENILGMGKDYLNQLRRTLQENQTEEIRCKSRLEANKISEERLNLEKKDLINEIEVNQEKAKDLEEKAQKINESFLNEKEKRNIQEKKREALLLKEQQEKQKEEDQHKVILSNQNQREHLEEKLLGSRSNIQEYKAQSGFLEGRLKDFEEAKSELETRLKSLDTFIAEGLDQKSLIENQHKELLADYTQNIEKQKKKVNELHLLTNNIQVNQSKADYLKNIQKNYQDYFPGIRKLMTSEKILGSRIHTVYGPVGELIQMDSRYIQAVDVALGGKSQNIVVEDVKTARDCIELLKSQRLGRATFLPLDNLRYALVDEKTKNQLKRCSGFEGIASELVKTNSQYKKAIESLLGRTIVAKDFKTGQDLYKVVQGRMMVVTLEGEIFYPGGAIVGGQNKEGKQSPLFKKVEIETLSKEIEKAQKDLEFTKEESQFLEETLNKQRGKLKTLEEKHTESKQRIWEKNKEKESVLKNLKENNGSKEACLSQITLLKEKGSELEKEILLTEEAYHKLKGTIEPQVKRIEVDSIRQSLDIIMSEISETQMEMTRLEGELKGCSQQSEMVKNQLDQQKLRLEGLESQLKNHKEESFTLKKRLEVLKSEVDGLNETLDNSREKNKNSVEQQKQNRENLEILREEIKKANHDLIVHNDMRNKLETQINSLKLKMDHWEEAIYDSYEMNLIMVEDIYEALKSKGNLEEIDLSEDRQRELKTKISGLGNVNLSAIEDYEEISKRHIFMKTQMADLESGKRELLDIINSLYDAMTEQFKEKFIVLQEKFTRIFGILFEGGRAYLEFTDPTGILEGGIELVAQPPGKRLRHISLLSGGEKSMVAISLLFSFLEINPSPFCVIDEIDAALDDHNIFRYISYLEKISAENQFITITHRRKTLEVCDNLYGVSMSRDGVSQLVSVRLSDYS